MIEEAVRRVVCEACEYTYVENGNNPYAMNGTQVRCPWDDAGDALAALGAWRKKRVNKRHYDIFSARPEIDRFVVVLYEDNVLVGESSGSNLPDAACHAIAAAWAKMKEAGDANI